MERADTSVDADQADAIRVEGRVKWFDAHKGYGFIQPEGSAFAGDVMVHISCVKAGGYEEPPEGATVVCMAVRRSKGMQAIEILDLDATTAAPARRITARRAPMIDGGPFEPATVKWFNRRKGYGFVIPENDQRDVFLHVETLRAAGFEHVTPEEKLLVRCGDGPKGRVVVEARPAAPGTGADGASSIAGGQESG